ncbi:MAG: hypothetical protein ABID84_04740 [Chloroflexota bacterium]
MLPIYPTKEAALANHPTIACATPPEPGQSIWLHPGEPCRMTVGKDKRGTLYAESEDHLAPLIECDSGWFAKVYVHKSEMEKLRHYTRPELILPDGPHIPVPPRTTKLLATCACGEILDPEPDGAIPFGTFRIKVQPCARCLSRARIEARAGSAGGGSKHGD